MSGFRIANLLQDGLNEIPIGEVEYNEIRQARAKLDAYTSLEEHFNLIVHNYRDVESYIFEASLDNMLFSGFRPDRFSDMTSRFNRLCIGMLSSVRLYVDTVVTLCRAVSDEDGLDDRVRTLLGEKYDASYHFRVMEALRNYAQHRALPTHSTAIRRSTDRRTRAKTFSVEFRFVTKYVQRDSKFKARTLSEIEELGGKVSLNEALREYFVCLAEFHHDVRRLLRPAIDLADGRCSALRERWLNGRAAGFADGLAVCPSNLEDSNDERIAWLDPQVDHRRKQIVRAMPLTNFRNRRLALEIAGSAHYDSD